MRESRIYCDQALDLIDLIEITGNKVHYIKHVLRLSVGDKIILFNGLGGELKVSISQINKNRISVLPEASLDVDRKSQLRIELGLAVLKRENMDLAIQKATELGVTTITPLITDNSSVPHKSLAKRQQHWREVAASACEQSGLNILPIIKSPITLPEWVPRQDESLNLVADLNAEQTFLSLPTESNLKRLGLIIGPEGGFSSDEETCLKQGGFIGIYLGPRVLRAETAVITMISLAQARWGDL